MKKLFTTALCLVLTLAAVNAKVIYVSTGGSDAKDGFTWENAKLTPNEAVKAAVSGDEVWIKGGKYTLNGVNPTQQDPASKAEAGIWLKEGVSIYGGFAGTESTKEERVRPNPETEPWVFANPTEITGGNRIDGGANGLRLMDRFDKTSIWTTMTTIDGLKISYKEKTSRNTYFKEKITLSNCAVVGGEDNTSVIYFEDGGSVINCLFEDCLNPLYMRGVDSAVERETMIVKNSTFRHNRTLPLNFYSTANAPFDSPCVEISECKFINNDIPFAALADGKYSAGGVYINHAGTQRPAIVANCLFEGNILRVQGASTAMITGGGYVNFNNNIIRNNQTIKEGSTTNSAGLFIVYTKPTNVNAIKVYNNLIVNNSTNDRLLYVVGSDFFNNTVANNNGGVKYFQLGSVTYNNIFANNHEDGVDTSVKLDAENFAYYSYNANTAAVTLEEEYIFENLLITDPGFKAPTTTIGVTTEPLGDFSLLENSACLEVGGTESFELLLYPAEWFAAYFTTDLAGYAISLEGDFNSGAYQFNAGSGIDQTKANAFFSAFSTSNGMEIRSEIAGTLHIYNVSGALVTSLNVEAGNTLIPMAKGVYIAKIVNVGQTAAVKVLVQ